MKKSFKLFYYLSIIAFLLNIVTGSAFALTVKAPIIIKNLNSKDQKPLIIGLVQKNAEVLIYNNGNFVGEAVVNTNESPTNDFYYEFPEQLSLGENVITAIAKEKTSLILSPHSPALKINITPPPAPTLISPNPATVTAKAKPKITGLARSNTRVHIYIDGVYNGKTGFLSHESGTADFVYEPFLNLGAGRHEIWAFSEDKSGRLSKGSEVLKFNIEKPLPAPIIFPPASNDKGQFIVGLAKNGLKIRVFIDKKLNGEFLVGNHVSGTANFAYQPYLPLAAGEHLVYVSALDSRGKESSWSNIVYFNNKNVPRISETAVAESAPEEPIVMGEEGEFTEEDLPLPAVPPLSEAEPLPVKEEDYGQEEPVDLSQAPETGDEPDISEIEEFLDQEPGEEKPETGAINETKEQQGKLKLNLIIFIFFLIAVIAWIFWVNRELIKERQAENEKEKK